MVKFWPGYNTFVLTTSEHARTVPVSLEHEATALLICVHTVSVFLKI